MPLPHRLPRGYRITVVDSPGPEWDLKVSGFQDASIEQSAVFSGFGARLFRLWGLLLHSQATGKLAAAALIRTLVLPGTGRGFAYLKFGPLWRGRGEEADPDVLTAALTALRDEFAVERKLLLRVLPPADPDYEPIWAHGLEQAAFRSSRPVPDPARYFVDLTLSEPEQTASLDAKWRANLRKALASGLTIREVDPQASLETFLDLYRGMWERKRFTDRHGIESLAGLAQVRSPVVSLRMFLAFAGDEAVAGSVLSGCGDRIFVPFSASSARGLALRAGYAVRWEVLNQLRDAGGRWLDLGGAEGNEGLRSFKLGNVGKRGRVVALPGEFDTGDDSISRAIASGLTLARDAAWWPGRRK